ncbi:Dihydrofolate reductase type 3 [Gammaproteobacteria bacterium]
MSLSIIAAIASNNVIGKNNKIPWSIPEELKHFYKLVYGKPVVMGRKTHESIGKPVENSPNVILSHSPSLQVAGCGVINSVADVLNLYQNDVEVIVIGGESIYRQFLPFVNKMYLTFIDHQFDGDTYFPGWQASEWETIEECAVQSHLYPYRFVILQRK